MPTTHKNETQKIREGKKEDLRFNRAFDEGPETGNRDDKETQRSVVASQGVPAAVRGGELEEGGGVMILQLKMVGNVVGSG